MSLPPALLKRLAQRGLVKAPKSKENEVPVTIATENEEVIAEDYDEMEPTDHINPEQYDPKESSHKRKGENYWLERMKVRMGESNSSVGHKGCPNKYNIWHKCSLFCVNRWGEGHSQPSREYMRRYRRLLRKYPLPKGWSEKYDPGCGCYYFYSTSDNMVSWLPPTHPKSQVTKSAATYRRQLEETNNDDGNVDVNMNEENAGERHQREIDDIINSSLQSRSPQILTSKEFPSLQETTTENKNNSQRKAKSRDLDRVISRHRRDRDRNHDHSKRHRRDDFDALDPMDPSAYSDTPRGKWSDGLHTGDDERNKSSGTTGDSVKERSNQNRTRHDDDRSDDDDGEYC